MTRMGRFIKAVEQVCNQLAVHLNAWILYSRLFLNPKHTSPLLLTSGFANSNLALTNTISEGFLGSSSFAL